MSQREDLTGKIFSRLTVGIGSSFCLRYYLMSFVAFCPLDSTLSIPVLTVSADVPTDSSTTPLARIYGEAGLIGTASLTKMDTGVLTGATNAAPIVITSANHGLSTGMKVSVSGVLGNTAANGSWTIVVVDVNTFSLTTSTGNGAYTSGGIWWATGLYHLTLTPTTAGGYAQGGSYTVAIISTGATAKEPLMNFGVI